jgi:thiol-disulfide isomerase/thioredoxin
MRTFLAVGFCLVLSSWLRAAPDGINPPVETADGQATAEPAAATVVWNQIGDEGRKVMVELQKHDPGVELLIPQVASDLKSYLTRFPKDTHVPEARLMSAQVDDLARGLNLPGAPTVDEVNREFGALAADPSLPMQLRAEASLMTITAALRRAETDEVALSKAGKGHSTQWDEVDARASAFEKDFGSVSFDGKSSAAAMLRAEQMRLLQQSNDTARLKALVAKLANDPHPEIAAMAKQAAADSQAEADLKTKPLDLSFTALDGSEVDLAKMRGKVVLIDFWATWCPPCVAEVPDVVAAYQKFHGQGFEIVGISLDHSKEALQTFLTAKGMTWPQYFDGKGWDNEISSRFGIREVPTMWLVGKDGVLVLEDARNDLAGQVQKLLQVH